MEVFHCDTAAELFKPSTRVTVGVMNLGEAVSFSDPFLAAARGGIQTHGVQFLMGLFGDTSEQISALCQDAVAAGTHAAVSYTPLPLPTNREV